MKCQTPGCSGEHEAHTISHTVIYRERELVIHGVPADICPDCGETILAHETIYHLHALLGRKTRAKRNELVYEA